MTVYDFLKIIDKLNDLVYNGMGPIKEITYDSRIPYDSVENKNDVRIVIGLDFVGSTDLTIQKLVEELASIDEEYKKKEIETIEYDKALSPVCEIVIPLEEKDRDEEADTVTYVDLHLYIDKDGLKSVVETWVG